MSSNIIMLVVWLYRVKITSAHTHAYRYPYLKVEQEINGSRSRTFALSV